MINPRNLVDHAFDLFQLAFSPQNRIKRYTQDMFYGTRLTVRCEKAPYVTHSSFDTCKIIDMAFDFSERFPDTWVDLEFTDDGLLYFSVYNGQIKTP